MSGSAATLVMGAVSRRIDDHCRVECHQQRVAVGIGLGDHVGADIAVGAGAVVDDDLLAECFAEFLADGARQRVGRTAGSVGHDQPDRFVRIGLGMAGMRKDHQRKTAAGTQ